MRPDYSTYTAIEFALDDTFIAYVLSETEKDGGFWEKWKEENPQKEQELESATKMIFAIQRGMSKYTSNHLSEEKENELLNKIQEYIQQNNTIVAAQGERKLLPLLLRIAAVFIVVTGIASYLLYFSFQGTYQDEVSKLGKHYQEYTNSTSLPDTFLLPDQSRVILQPQSQIAYTQNFNDTLRAVILRGGARFDVVKNAQKPFVVFANQIATRVLGTVFDIEGYENKREVKVMVREGKVAIYRVKDSSNSVQSEETALLQANQVLHYQLDEDRYTKKLIDYPHKLPFTKHITMQYESTSLKTVFEDIQQAYGILIVYDASAIRHCQLTASLGDESFADLLKVICTSVGLHYEIVETSVIITGKGCSNLN